MFPKLPADTPRRTQLFLDAIEYLIAGGRHHYDLMRGLGYAKAKDATPEDEPSALSSDKMAVMVAQVTAFLNTVNRLRSLLQQIPADDEMRVIRKAFISQVAAVEPVRHHLEHLNTAIPATVDTGSGAFGAISWWFEKDHERLLWFTMIPGHVGQGQQSYTKMPGEMRDEIDHFWVTIASQIFDVSNVYYALVRLEESIIDWSGRQAEDGWPVLASVNR